MAADFPQSDVTAADPAADHSARALHAIPNTVPSVALSTTPNEVLSDLVRLQLVSLLDTEQWCRFAFLCEAAGISGDRLKRHFYLLRGRGYVLTIRSKDGAGWALLTPYGQAQRDDYMAMLSQLVPRARAQVGHAQHTQPDWFKAVEQP